MQREGNKFVEKIRFFTEFTLRKACVFRMANLLVFFELSDNLSWGRGLRVDCATDNRIC